MIKVGQIYTCNKNLEHMHPPGNFIVEIIKVSPGLIQLIANNYSMIESQGYALEITGYFRNELIYTLFYREFQESVKKGIFILDTIATMKNMLELKKLGLIDDDLQTIEEV